MEASKREDFFDNAKAIVKNFFATVNTEYEEELFCPGVDEKGTILAHPDFLRNAFDMGERIVSKRDEQL